MQKVINVLAVLSFVGTAGIICGGTVVYLRRDAIPESVKESVAKAETEEEQLALVIHAEALEEIAKDRDMPPNETFFKIIKEHLNEMREECEYK